MSRRLDPEEARRVLERAEPIPTRRAPDRPAPAALVGRDLAGDATCRPLSSPTVVLFLSTTCEGCRDLASVVRDGAPGFHVLGVLRAPRGGLPSADLAGFAGGGGDWLVGDEPFVALEVSSAPFFCVVDGAVVLLEGVAFGAGHLAAHLERLRAGSPRPDAVRLRPDTA